MTKRFSIYEFLKTRPLSWSAISTFAGTKEYQPKPEQWYTRYILNQKSDSTVEMEFGKAMGERIATDPTFLPHVPRYLIAEHELRCSIGKIPLIGFMDFFEPDKKMIELKTGRALWTQKRVDIHKQIDMYLLMHYLMTKIKPEDMDVQLVWLPTVLNGDFTVDFLDENDIKIFRTRRTLAQVLGFVSHIQKTVEEMEQYVLLHD